MDKGMLADIVNGERKILAHDADELKQLADKYPYAQIFSIMYLKALSQSKSLDFDEILPQYAYRITDREKLFEILYGESIPDLTSLDTVGILDQPTDTQPEIDKVVGEFSLSETVLIEEIEHGEETVGLTPEATPIDGGEQYIEPSQIDKELDLPKNEDVKPDESLLNTTDKSNSSEQEEDLIEEQIIANVVDNLYPQMVENLAEANKNSDDNKEEIIGEPISNEKEIGTLKAQEEYSFLTWLTRNADEKEILIDNSFKDPIERAEKNKIIEDFIENNPSISRPKREFFSPSKAAKESLDKTGLIYSETLANIYEIQGNFPLAIKAYEQLSLTIPEKRVIFAKKIELLKEKLDNLKQ